MNEEQLNASGDIDQPVDDNSTQPTNNNEATDTTSESIDKPGVVIAETTVTEETKPEEPAEPATEQPTTQSEGTDSAPQESVVVSEATTVTAVEAEPAQQPTITQPDQPKKGHTGLIMGIIIAALLLGGGGALAAFAVIKNQPENIALESFSNLMNAKQVAVTGSFTFTPGSEIGKNIGPISIQIDTKNSNANHSTDTSLEVNYPEIDQPINLDFGEVMMSDGVFYLKASGLQKIYEDIVADKITEYLESQLESRYKYSIYQDCEYDSDIDTYLKCLDQPVEIADPTILASIQSQVAIMKNHIENIIEDVDDEWFEFSIDDILDSDLVKEYIDSKTKDSITKAYNCFTDMNQNLQNYTGEFADLYASNQFMVLKSDQDSFYKITFDANKLAGYLNGVPRTKLVTDYASCNGINLTDNMIGEIKADDISKVLDVLPDVYARFDGFLDHHLTDLKINGDYGYYTISSNLNFAYPSNLVVSAPAESTPVMEVVEDIVDEIEAMVNELEA